MSKTILYVLGAILVVVGILGFISDPVFGLFEVNMLHNLVHLITGLALLWGGYVGGAQARSVAIVLGVVYALVAALGLVLPGDVILGIIESNLSDDSLHIGLAIVLLYAGFTAEKSGSPVSMSTENMPSANGMSDQ
ncbi:MAG TPA: DUF4383 domain-containing protein [Candidatus Paceibacterota bacterium]|jgi:hypothetical protein